MKTGSHATRRRPHHALRWALALWLILACAACGAEPPEARQASAVPQTEAPSTVAVIRLEGEDWGYPSPYAHYPRGPGGFKMALIFDSLLERGEKGLIPWLAEAYEISPDGRTYTFTIRRNVAWHDGRPLTAEDVRFSIDYASRHPRTWSYVFDAIESAATGPDRTVRVTVRKPTAPMLYNLGLTRIIPKHVWEKVETPKSFTAPEAVIGSGPYRLTGYSKEHGTYRFEAFDRFWGPKPRVRRIEFVPVSEPLLAYERGEIDLVRVTPDLLSRVEADPANRVVRSPAFWGFRLLFNMDRSPALRDVRVRQALAHAIDRRELVEKIVRGAGVPGSPGILPPDHVMAAGDVRGQDFDPRKAAQLLASAGYGTVDADGMRRDAQGATLAFELLCSSRDKPVSEVRMAEVLRQRLAAAGVAIDIRSVDVKTRDARVRNLDYQLAIIGHGGWGQDPDYLAAHLGNSGLAVASASPNHSRIAGLDHPELDALLTRQRLTIDPEARRTLIHRLQHLVAEVAPELALFYTTAYSVYRPATYDGWTFMYDHHSLAHSKLSFLDRKQPIPDPGSGN